MKHILEEILKIIPHLSEQRDILKQVGLDFQREDMGASVFFPLDFYEISNYLFPLSAGAQDAEVVRYYFENLKHKMVLLPPTALEMIRYLKKQADWLRTLYHPSSRYIDEFLDSRELINFYKVLEEGASVKEIEQAYHTMGRYRRILRFLQEDAVSRILEGPAEQFIKLLKEQKIVDLESVIDDSTWDGLDEITFDKALETFDKRRPDISKGSANRVDALNLALVFALNDVYYNHVQGKHFLIVTHGATTHRIYSKFRWEKDPTGLKTDVRGTRLNRNHLYCAYHAYFEQQPYPQEAIKNYLNGLDEVDPLKERFKNLFDRYGHEYLSSLSLGDDPTVTNELKSLHKELKELQRPLIVFDKKSSNKHEAIEINDVAEFMGNLKSKNEIRSILKTHAAAANKVVRLVFENVESIVKNPSIKVINQQFEEEVESILSADDSALPTEDRESLLVEALIRGNRDDLPLIMGQSYKLIAGIRWYSPAHHYEYVEQDFFVLIQAQNIAVSGEPFQPVSVEPNGKTNKVEFIITPDSTGDKTITVHFFREQSAVAQVDLEIKVVDKSAPPFRQDYSQITSDYKPAPSPHYLDSVTLQVTTKRMSENSYDCALQFDGTYFNNPINLSPIDIQSLNHEMQRKARILAFASDLDNPDRETDIQQALRSLAHIGMFAYKRIFSGEEVQRYLRGALPKDQKVVIQVNSSELVMPWDLLYDGDLGNISIDGFWGMRYIISRARLQGRRDGSFISPKIQYKGSPKIGLFTDRSLEAAVSHEIPFFEQLENETGIKLIPMPPLESTDPEALNKFIQFWHTSFHIAHFACHAFAEEGDFFKSYLQLSNDYPVRLSDLTTYEFRAIDNPLVILNACHTGVVDSLSTLNFAEAFLRCGARGVIATECEMPDLLAAQFASEFFTHFLKGNSLGESLNMTRISSWRKNRVAVPLLYAMYAPESVRLLNTNLS